ncbi:cell wall hydrolase [Candidatus Saccharibacteria bacterium]|nr:cell wall hydrolase [Candidatus Saccharibacteria bacterium]
MRKDLKELINTIKKVNAVLDLKFKVILCLACALYLGAFVFAATVVVTEIRAEGAEMYSEEDARLLAQVMLNEAGGVPSQTEQSMVAWTVLNRVDDGRFGSSIYAVLSAPAQFAWWSSTAVRDDLLVLARDVLIRWNREKNGETEVGRTLPSDKLYFYGDGVHNYFYASGEGGTYSFAEYPTPYTS